MSATCPHPKALGDSARAHEQLEADKPSNKNRFYAVASVRFASNARKHKAKLDAAMYERGRAARVRGLHKS